MSDLVREIEAEIKALEADRVVARQELADAKVRWRASDREMAAKLRRLSRARDLIAGGTLDSHVKAGPAVVDAVRRVIEDRRVATQAEITKVAGLNSGSVTYALRALEADGVLRDTGRKVGRSREFEIVG